MRMNKKKIIIVSVLLFVLLFVVPFLLDVSMMPWPAAVAYYLGMTRFLIVGMAEIAATSLLVPLLFWAVNRIMRRNRKTT
jgi:hypothetical protein